MQMRAICAISLSVVCLSAVAALASPSSPAGGQENYEIQVYAAPTQPKGRTMYELHSNYTFRGQKTTFDGTVPSNHSLHETLEITRGLSDWSELALTEQTPAGSTTLPLTHDAIPGLLEVLFGLPGFTLGRDGGVVRGRAQHTGASSAAT